MRVINPNTLLIFILSILCFSGCDAPRNNPFDPFNEESHFVILDGTVTSKIDNEPIADVKVTFLPYNISAYSNADGTFAFDYFQSVNGLLRLEKAGLFSDSVFIEWGKDKKKSFSLSLDYRPKLNNLLYYSVVQNRYNLPSLDHILVKTKVTELGNAIDSVFLRYSGEYIKTLDFNVSTKFFETTVIASEMGFNSIDDVIGKEIEVIITNTRGQETTAGLLKIQRVIRAEIEPEWPSSADEVFLPINFSWKKYSPGFSYSYLLQIYTNEIEPQLVSQKAYSSSNDNYSFGSYVDPGEYFWVLWSIDEFGNRSRSKPLSFTLR